MDEILVQNYNGVSSEDIAIYTAVRSARANVMAKIVNLPQVLDESIRQIEERKQVQEKMKSSTESGDISGRRPR